MLRELKLSNFRGFEKHQVPLKNLTVIVGQNNAGKTTLVEALRLVAIVISRYKNLEYKTPPEWTDLPKREYGVSPSIRNLEINFDGLFHRYEPPPAIIEGHFSNGSSVTIYLNANEEIFAVLRDSSGNTITKKSQATKANLPLVSILPQVGPVQKNERILTRHSILRGLSSSVSSSHFRNQLNLFYKDYFKEFQMMVENTWPGVRVEQLIGQGKPIQSSLDLHIRNESFVGEISLMGHGLQMWLQTMWFLVRSDVSTTVILDEPDVYMHPDLQRRVIRFLRGRFDQTIITTHSVEIMSEVDPGSILVVDKSQEKSGFATSLPAVQRITENIGSVHNIHLTRLWTSKRFLLLEGKDLSLLKILKDILFPNSDLPLETIPHMSIGGWGGWNLAVGSSMTLLNALGETIEVFCILDRDYHTKSEIEERYQKANDLGVNLHIWSQKEIENYLLSPDVLHRYISKRVSKRTQPPDLDEIREKVEELASSMEDDVFDAFSSEELARDRDKRLKRSNKTARDFIKPYMENRTMQLIVSGKELISKLSTWSQSEFNVQINVNALAREFKKAEIHPEMEHVLTSIERSGLI